MNPSARKTAGWIALTVTALLIIPVSLQSADTTGRDFSRCIRACIAAKQSCADQCLTDCRNLFPGDPQQQSACASACKTDCVATEDDCKGVCRAIKQGTSPNEPT